MKILSAEQIRNWDRYTIEHEPVSSIDLMERAAKACANWIIAQKWQPATVRIFCGKGNNGGDGLAIGRMLLQAGYRVSFYILEFGKPGSEDFQINLQRLHQLPAPNIHFIQDNVHFPPVHENDLVIDALFGSGLNKPLEGLSAELVMCINQSAVPVLSIDLPSGLFMDRSSKGAAIVAANYTLTFQCYKTALLLQENAPFIGEVRVLDIGLHPAYLEHISAGEEYLDEKSIRKIFRPRQRFSHKGSFGHALLAGGSYGKMGAIVLATRACLGTGAGLTTVLIPRCGYTILQTAAPEAMALVDAQEEYLTSIPEKIDRFDAVGIGPGLGTSTDTQNLLSFFLRRYQRPMVIDADGLNILAANNKWLQQVPAGSILTPHPKEFDRLFGEHTSDFDRVKTAKEKAAQLNVIIVLKGHHSLIATPSEEAFFNSTGNAGMAKGGSGDVLTGMLTALLAQGYNPAGAAKLGVYLHGWAGDFAAKKFSKEAMLPSHLIECLRDVFLALQST